MGTSDPDPLLSLEEYLSTEELMQELLIATLKSEAPGFDLENPEFESMLGAGRDIVLKFLLGRNGSRARNINLRGGV